MLDDVLLVHLKKLGEGSPFDFKPCHIKHATELGLIARMSGEEYRTEVNFLKELPRLSAQYDALSNEYNQYQTKKQRLRIRLNWLGLLMPERTLRWHELHAQRAYRSVERIKTKLEATYSAMQKLYRMQRHLAEMHHVGGEYIRLTAHGKAEIQEAQRRTYTAPEERRKVA